MTVEELKLFTERFTGASVKITLINQGKTVRCSIGEIRVDDQAGQLTVGYPECKAIVKMDAIKTLWIEFSPAAQ